jgi:PKHD-type hydroxylase
VGSIPNYRNSKLCWLYSHDDLHWAFERITGIVVDLNQRFFNFDLFGLNEGLQFTNYKAPGGDYKKHIDRAVNFPVRKLSLSVQLTDPKKYEGGDLILHDSTNKAMKKEQGTLILFPSYILHEVTPVTKGERNSLVTWVTGKQFK